MPAWLVPAIAAGGLALGKALAGRKKKASVERTPLYIPPPYKPSQYDAPSAAQLHGTYSSRARGEGVGYAPEDLSAMNAQAIDEATRLEQQILSRGAAGRARTGGLTTGGADTIRENVMLQGGMARSKAMRDIAINNAVLKRREQSEAIGGLHNFLGAERAEAHNIFRDEVTRSNIINQDITQGNEAADYVNQYNQARREQNVNTVFDAADYGIQAAFPQYGAARSLQSIFGNLKGNDESLRQYALMQALLGANQRKSLSNYRGR